MLHQISILKNNLIDFFHSSFFKKMLFVTIFLFFCYISMDLLNGAGITLKPFFDFSEPFGVKKVHLIRIFNILFSPWKFWITYVILISFYFILYGLTNNIKVSCSIIYISTIVFGILNYIVKQVRGVPIVISDIFSIKDALNVSKGINLQIDGNFIFAILLGVITIFIMWKFIKFSQKKEKHNIIIRIILFCFGFIIIVSIYFSNFFMDKVNVYIPKICYEKNGTPLTLMKMIKNLKLKKPDNNYTNQDVDNILANYTNDSQDRNKKLPNILVVLNESFADLQSIYDLNLKEDNLPNFHEIKNKNNVISGVMHSSSFGAFTANVEYEFLTQNTVAFLPKDSVPYQQYINKKVNTSIVSHLNSLNYNTYGIHSFHKSGYNRFKVYDFLQFKNKMFLEDMNNVELGLNGYATDSYTYKSWYDIMNSKPKDEKNFTFILTMENHSPFSFESENITKFSNISKLNSYLQSENSSDKALKELIDYVDNYEENTVVLFFGDHQPYIEGIESVPKKKTYSNTEYKYIIPFIIYANFDIGDIEKKSDIETSTNYLQSLLFDVAKIPKNSYDKYISDLKSEIPVITSNYYKDKNGKYYAIDDVSSPYYDKLQEYWSIIYFKNFT